MADPLDDRPAMTMALVWASRATSIALEMALPALGGYWLDGKLGTRPMAVIVGAVFGLVAGMWHLTRLTPVSPPAKRDSEQPPDGPRRP